VLRRTGARWSDAGPGGSPDLSEIEERLLIRVIETVVNEWCGFWRDSLDLRPVIVGHESSGPYLQIGSPESMLLVMGVETQIRDSAEQLYLAFPSSVVDLLIAKLSTASEIPEKATAKTDVSPLRGKPAFEDLSLHLSAEVALQNLTAREVLNSSSGTSFLSRPDQSTRSRSESARFRN
jgi:flagellar motor switch protein FliM